MWTMIGTVWHGRPARVYTGETPVPHSDTGETPVPQSDTGETPVPHSDTGETPVPQWQVVNHAGGSQESG